MARSDQIAQELSVIMPKIARSIHSAFSKTYSTVPPAQIFAILLLSEHGRCRFSDLSKGLHVSPPTVTGIVDRLAKQGCVKRVHDTEDRRAVNVELTQKGVRMAKEIESGVQKKWKRMLELIPEKDGEDYLRIVKKIYKQIL